MNNRPLSVVGALAILKQTDKCACPTCNTEYESVFDILYIKTYDECNECNLQSKNGKIDVNLRKAKITYLIKAIQNARVI